MVRDLNCFFHALTNREYIQRNNILHVRRSCTSRIVGSHRETTKQCASYLEHSTNDQQRCRKLSFCYTR